MTKTTLADQEPTIIATSIFTASAMSPRFRAAEVLFYIDVFRNLFQAERLSHEVRFQTIQIIRILDRYTKDGWAERSVRAGRPTFRLTTNGLIGVLGVFAAQDYHLRMTDAIFLQNYLLTYRGIIERHVQSGGPLSPEQAAVLQSILKPQSIFIRQLAIVEQRIQDVRQRIQESEKLDAYIDTSLKGEVDIKAVIAGMPSPFSYRLHHRKPFKEWLEEMPQKLAEHELREGFQSRRRHYYAPSLSYLELQRQFLQQLIAAP